MLRLRYALILGLPGILIAMHCQAQQTESSSREELLEQMQSLARLTKVDVAKAKDREAVKLLEKPVFRYSDQPRGFVDATMWAWTSRGRPIAFQKIEAMNKVFSGKPMWQYCFASFSENLLSVQWSEDRKYRSSQAGVAFRPVPDPPGVAPRAAERRRQTRELARSFSARIITDIRTAESQEMRLLTTPILEYSTENADMLQGAVFGYSTNGTNPDLLIAIEVRKAEEKPVWHFAPARMTIGGLTVACKQKKVWECEAIEPGQGSLATWTYFQTARVPGEDEQ
jgi:hypothetical protein